MFAVIKTGGKQYKVAQDSILEIEKLEAEEGDVVSFEEVLMVGGDKPQIGAPLVAGMAVHGEVISQKRGEKVINFVKRRRKHGSQRRKGHRQYLTVVKITAIGGAAPKASAPKTVAVEPTFKPAKKTVAKKAAEARGTAKPAAKPAAAKKAPAKNAAAKKTEE